MAWSLSSDPERMSRLSWLRAELSNSATRLDSTDGAVPPPPPPCPFPNVCVSWQCRYQCECVCGIVSTTPLPADAAAAAAASTVATKPERNWIIIRFSNGPCIHFFYALFIRFFFLLSTSFVCFVYSCARDRARFPLIRFSFLLKFQRRDFPVKIIIRIKLLQPFNVWRARIKF